MNQRLQIPAFFSLAVLLLSAWTVACHQPGTVAAATPVDSVITVKPEIREAIKQAKAMLQDGDLVTRSDDDLESITLRNFSNTDRSYSHSGIAFKEDSGFVIYHCMTGEENPSGLCRKDPFDSFVNPLQKTGFGLFRYQLSEKEKAIFHQVIEKNFIDKIPFDLSFNLHTDDSLYCSEMVYKALKKATNNRIQLPLTVLMNFKPKVMGHRYGLRFPKDIEFVSLDNLYLNPFCKEIMRVSYR